MNEPAFLDLVSEARRYEQAFMLFPRYWLEYAYPRRLTWNVVPFVAQKKALVPQVPGVYAFLVQSTAPPTLAGCYIMYVGQSNSLKRRFSEYAREESSSSGRPKIRVMLGTWKGFVHFAYAPVPPSELNEAESALLRALWPPMNPNLPADINRVRKAFGH